MDGKMMIDDESERLENLMWFSEIKMILLKTGFGGEKIDDVVEEIYQATGKYFKGKKNETN